MLGKSLLVIAAISLITATPVVAADDVNPTGISKRSATISLSAFRRCR